MNYIFSDASLGQYCFVIFVNASIGKLNMPFKINIIRRIKWLLIKFKFHLFLEPFAGLLLNFVYLAKVSKWISLHRSLPFNDFYSSKWDYTKRFRLYEYVFNELHLDGEIVYLEFGVSGGYSFLWWVKKNLHPGSRFIGFDTFEGLPKDWGGFKKGTMTTYSQVPFIDDHRATFIKGLFQDTLWDFLQTLDKEKTKVIMMDADLYSSTLFVLTSIAQWLKKGDIIFFDQFNVPRHEFLAFSNFIESYYLNFRLIGASNNYYFCAFEKI